MASGDLAATGSNPGTGIDAQGDSHLDERCSYANYLGEKFYEYVAVIEMIYVLATDEAARKQLIEDIAQSGWYHAGVAIGSGQLAAQSNEAAGALAIWEFLGFDFGDRGSAAMLKQGQEAAELSREHAALAWQAAKDYFVGLYNEIRRRYRECGLAYAFATVATDGVFFLGELALGAGAAGIAAKVLKKLKFIVRRTPRGVEVEVQNPKGGSVKRTFTKEQLEGKYGKPDQNHQGVLEPDTNRDVDGDGKPDADPKKLSTGAMGAAAEAQAKKDLAARGFTQQLTIQNPQGNGVDIIARNPSTGQTMFAEVKANTATLSGDQATMGGPGYVRDRLTRVTSRSGEWSGATTQQRRDAYQALSWLNGNPDFKEIKYTVDPQTGAVSGYRERTWNYSQGNRDKVQLVWRDGSGKYVTETGTPRTRAPPASELGKPLVYP